jgi:rare lipoprotein A
MHPKNPLLIILLILLFLGCSTAPRYTRGTGYSRTSKSRKDPPPPRKGVYQVGVASYYGKDFHGRKTANGETYDMYAMTCAHKELPFNTMLLVTNLDNGRQIKVRVNDRGPFVKNRIIDLSKGAAKKIGLIQTGTARVRLEVID